ncbi:MAG: RimK/LysX family protein [Brumimicrobium sp.]|nr:RimK/LysX family protein [Brumimicrobium sp.]
MAIKKERHIIGKNDIADFPSFNLQNVKVKIDSGAYTSTIHCSKVEKTEEGLKVIFLEKKTKGYSGEIIHFQDYQIKKVRSSNGILQERFVVKGNITLFGQNFNTEFTLTSRKLMRFPILLGRKLLNKGFLINTSQTNLSYKLKKKLSE